MLRSAATPTSGQFAVMETNRIAGNDVFLLGTGKSFWTFLRLVPSGPVSVAIARPVSCIHRFRLSYWTPRSLGHCTVFGVGKIAIERDLWNWRQRLFAECFARTSSLAARVLPFATP